MDRAGSSMLKYIDSIECPVTREKCIFGKCKWFDGAKDGYPCGWSRAEGKDCTIG